ncbi:MAG: tetratricopeptide repeat protein [Lysobacterales bacterium]
MHVPLQQRSGVLLLAALLLTLLIYLPGLNGGYVYDDMVFIVDNLALHVTTTDWGAWVGAADSFPATHQGRWLGMLSFAGNHFLHGLDPWGYKLTNLLIHLVNGCLVWLCLRALFALYREVHEEQVVARSRHELAAAMLAALWLVLPINLTGVLYVFQRVESLSNTFVFLGLWAYLRLRLLDWRGVDCSFRLVTAVVGATATGLLVKESAVLLPLYIACVELTITSGKRRDGRWSHAMGWTFLLCFLLPLLLGLVWLLSWVGGERSYVRTFGTTERLLTQARVLVHYIHWTLLPNLSDLTLYHDDIEVSRGLLQPWTTLPSLLLMLLLPALALWKRRRLPLMSLGILWFLAGHSLTATVIPLMLAFEHRNYFPSLGLLLALASILGLEQTWLRARLQVAVFALMFLFLGATTHLRALEWSSPLRLAASEASKRPNSADAQYAYARALMRASGGNLQDPTIDKALALLEARRSMPGAGITFDQGILILKARRGMPIDPALWQSMIETLTREPPSSSDISAMSAIYNCMNGAACPRQYAELRRMLEAALAHPQADAHVYSLYGQVVFRDSGELAPALRAFDEALRLAPGDLRIRYSRIATLIEAGDLIRARDEIEQMANEGVKGSVDRYVLPLRDLLSKARTARAASGPKEPDAGLAPSVIEPAGR